jgi:HlyD family secretion protein
MNLATVREWLRKTWVRVGMVVVVIVVLFVIFGGGDKGPFYDTQAVEQGTLRQTVEVTGETKPQTRIDLSFKTSGKLESLNVIVGQEVKQGDVLATLDAQEATFAMRRAAATLAQMQANLAARQAQDSPQAIQIAEAQRDQAKAGYEKAVSDLEQVKVTASEQVRVSTIALDTARANLSNSGSGVDIGVETSIASLRSSLVSANASMSSALAEADAVLGVENSGANDLYESVLGIYNRASLTKAQGMFVAVRSAQRRAESLTRQLSSNSTSAEVLAAGQATVEALQQVSWLLDETQTVLTNSGTNTALSITELTTKRSTIQTLRTTISTQYGTLSASVQGLQTSENTRTTTRAQLENAVKTAEANLAIARANERSQVKSAETAIEVQRATLASAEATLSQRKTPARAVDLQVLRTQVQDAQIAYEQAVQRVADTELRAPVAGVITEVVPSSGEQIAQNAKIMGLVVTGAFTVEASVPEADIAKFLVDQRAETTLDAFGDDVKFSSRVLSIEPDRIKIQDAVFYKVAIAIDPTDKPIKPGMTANVIVTTAEIADTLSIPVRAVRTVDGVRRVRVLEGEEVREKVIETGLRADDGKIQVTSGLSAGEQVITAELTADEYKARQMEQLQK